MIDCTSDTICGLTGVETELNLNDRSLTIRMSVLPLHYIYYHNLFIYQEREIEMLLHPCVHEKVAAAFLLHLMSLSGQASGP